MMRARALTLLCALPACGGLASVDSDHGLGPCIRPDDGEVPIVGDGTSELVLNSGPVRSFELGPEMVAELSHGDSCCWLVQMRLSGERSTSPRFCQQVQQGMAMVQIGHALREPDRDYLSVSWDCEDGSVLSPRLESGDVLDHSCSGELDGGSLSRNGSWTYDGIDSVAVGTGSIDAHRFREVATMAGKLTGEQRATYWFATGTRMLVAQDSTSSFSVVRTGNTTTVTDAWSWRLAR